MPLGINSRLSRIECPSGFGPWAGLAGDTLGYKKKKKKGGLGLTFSHKGGHRSRFQGPCWTWIQALQSLLDQPGPYPAQVQPIDSLKGAKPYCYLSVSTIQADQRTKLSSFT